MSAPAAAAASTRAARIWPHAANAVLGLWLATAPATFGPHRAGLLWSDVISGVLIVLLSALAWMPRFRWAAWCVAAVGLWLMAAPLLFWAPTAAAYAIDTLTGTLVVALAVLVPGSAGMRDIAGPDAPPEWSYNPSAWPQRAGIIALAIVQFFAARHLAAYQLGHVAAPWDPFFGDGTQRVLDSDVSRAFPVSDAGLGAFTYLLEALTGFLGGTRRWRTMPWAVMLFGVLVVPVGIVSIVLVILQPLAVGAWCSLCLFTAFLTVFMVSPAVDEIVASGQFLVRSRRAGRSFWRTFWRGGTEPGTQDMVRPIGSLPRELAGGMELNSIPWNLMVCAAVGVWLIVAPSVLGLSGHAVPNSTLTGALVATFAVIGFGEAARPARLVNVLVGLWLVISPLVLWDDTADLRWPEAAAGVAVILLSIRRGPVEGRYGSWDRVVV
jgi:uncharacterized membrane protein